MKTILMIPALVLALVGCNSERAGGGELPAGGGPSPSSAAGDGGGDASGGGGGDASGSGGGDASGSGGAAAESCDEGAVEECRVEVGKQNGIETCFTGQRTCFHGSWGNCRRVAPTGDEG